MLSTDSNRGGNMFGIGKQAKKIKLPTITKQQQRAAAQAAKAARTRRLDNLDRS